MRTRFETYVYRTFLQKRAVFGTHGAHGIHLGMSFATTYMITFANDAVVMHDYSAYHGVGRRSLFTLTG